MRSPSEKNVLLGKGQLLFQPIIDDVLSERIIHLGNAPAFTVKPEVETIELLSSMDESASVYAEDVKAKKLTFNQTLNEVSRDNLGLIFLGEEKTVTQLVAADAEHTISAAAVVKGGYYKVPHRDISNLVAEQAAVPVTGVEIVDAALGIIRVRADSTAAEGTAIDLTYDAAAITGLTAISALARNKVEGRLFFIPRSSRGPKTEVIFWHVTLTPESELPFISDEYAEFDVSGSVLDDRDGAYGGSADFPFSSMIQRPAA